MDTLFSAADTLERAIELSVAGREDDLDASATIAALRAAASPTRDGAQATGPRQRKKKRGASAPLAAPATITIHVRQTPDTPMAAVRAYLVLERAKTLGTVVHMQPAPDAFDTDTFDGRLTIGMDTGASDEEIDRAIRSAGHVAEVSVTRTGAGEAKRPVPPNGEAALPGGTGGRASELVAARQHRHIRIDLHRLDTLMNLIGELVITRGRLQQLATTINEPALTEAVTQTSRLVADLQDGIMTSRMVPVWQVFDRFPRVVRDAARALGTQVDFVVEGQEIELDRSLRDEIGDPVVHLLRNAIDHGIESPADRKAAGKPAEGQLRLEALRDRSAIVIRVTDDGKGIDRDRVLRKAKDAGLVEGTRADLSDDELIRLISRPGFSTAERITDISGRGVGIDAVQTRVRALGGLVEIRSVPKQGTTVTVRLPLTLAIVRALLSRVGDELYALPMTHVNETVELKSAQLRRVKGKEVLVLRDDVLPLLRMREVMGLPPTEQKSQQVVVIEIGERRAGLIVDELVGQQEIVVKQFDGVRGGLALFSGATILGDGAPALIGDVSSLL